MSEDRSPGPAEILKRMTRAYLAGDFDAAFELIDPEIVWIEPEGFAGAGTYHGHEGVRESLTKFVGTWDDYRIEHFDFRERDDKLIVRAHISGRGRSSGVPVEFDQWQVWTFRNGKAVRMKMFLEEDEAVQEAGLEPSSLGGGAQ